MQAEGMFAHVTDYGYARNARQAVGFYLFHLLIGALGFALAALCWKLLTGAPAGVAATLTLAQVAIVLSIGYVGWLSYRILRAKNRLGQPVLWAAGVLGLMLASIGMLLGLIVVACFSILNPAPVAACGDILSREEQP